MKYIQLQAEIINPELFAHFRRHQTVSQCWRKIDGLWQVKNIAFTEDWNAAEYGKVAVSLKNTVINGGVVFGAFSGDALKGFSSVEPGLFGTGNEYLDLSNIHVSEDMRSQGIGKELFRLSKEWAKQHGAQKLYISAHSSVESQAFYRAMGCVEANEYHKEHVEREPYDCQLECPL